MSIDLRRNNTLGRGAARLRAAVSRFSPLLLSAVPLIFALIIIYVSLRPVLIVSDPVWRSVVLEGEEGILPQLRIAMYNSFSRIELTGIDVFSGEIKGKALSEKKVRDSLMRTIERHRASLVILSPALSVYAGELRERYPERRFVYFSERGNSTGTEREREGRHIAVSADLREALQHAGEHAAALIASGERVTAAMAADAADKTVESGRDGSGSEDGEGPVLVVLRLGGDANGRRNASFFIKGLEGAGYSGRVERLVLDDTVSVGSENRDGEAKLVEKLRDSGVGSADFVWIWGQQGLTLVLETLDDWAVPSCVVGASAHEAFPGTVALSIEYEWKEALKRAVARLRATSVSEFSKEGSVVRMKGVLRVYR